MTAEVFDSTACQLGEGPLWHPERGQLFWFDIVGCRLHTRDGSGPRTWSFGENVSAAGWVSRDELLIASETQLFLFEVETGRSHHVAPLEADIPATRSNDGRADPWGGFWIGTMGKKAEPGLGSIYRYYRGEVRRLYPDISITNAICFAPDRSVAYWTDTNVGIIMRQRLDADTGWPEGAPEAWLTLDPKSSRPDGAVVDAAGNLWNAQWGGHRVACYAPDGTLLRAVEFPAAHTSCPAFGGDDMSTLFCTSARQGLPDEALAAEPRNGMTFMARGIARGQAEHRVIL